MAMGAFGQFFKEKRIEAGRMDMVMNSEEVARLCGELLAHRKAWSEPIAYVGDYTVYQHPHAGTVPLYRKPSTD